MKPGARLERPALFPESSLPRVNELVQAGRDRARHVRVAGCAFLEHYGVSSEAEYKRRCMADSRLMLHAQIGYRDPRKTRRAAREIFLRLDAEGLRVDRYGICLDWSMGYPRKHRSGMPRGTGLILGEPGDFAALTASAPVAPHFGDFVIGTPAAFENTQSALSAGATSIGNLGQYFTFRQPRIGDDVHTTAETVKALALIAAQPVEVLVHSNLDDGFAATFSDLASTAGMVMLERYIVCDLLGARIAHCYGHTFTEPVTRLAFQRVLADASQRPGTMVYGNTTSYGENHAANYANLAAYLLVDIQAQTLRPTGHALNPVPVTEAERIPEVEEIVDAHLFANRLIARTRESALAAVEPETADSLAVRLMEAGAAFKSRVLGALDAAGVDTANAFELLLALRRLGARRLEALSSGSPTDGDSTRAAAVAPSPYLNSLHALSDRCFNELDPALIENIRRQGLKGCVACSDVHEYGKRLLENVLARLSVEVIDGGVSVDPEALADTAVRGGADFIALSTYNGVALDYVSALMDSLSEAGSRLPVFIGGKLNQIPEASNTALPVDVSKDLAGTGAIPCRTPGDMIVRLAPMGTGR